MHAIADALLLFLLLPFLARYVERNAGGMRMQRFVVCVGWDRRVFVFSDDTSREVQGYMYCMPRSLDPYFQKGAAKTLSGLAARSNALLKAAMAASGGHTADIVALAFCPPDAVASAGHDGAVILWSLDSGAMLYKIEGALSKPAAQLGPGTAMSQSASRHKAEQAESARARGVGGNIAAQRARQRGHLGSHMGVGGLQGSGSRHNLIHGPTRGSVCADTKGGSEDFEIGRHGSIHVMHDAAAEAAAVEAVLYVPKLRLLCCAGESRFHARAGGGDTLLRFFDVRAGT